MKPIFKVVYNVISDKHVKTYTKYEYKPKKAQSPLINVNVYDLETFNTDRAAPYATGINKLSKISGKYHQDITDEKYQNV